jgi:hypothetical protein
MYFGRDRISHIQCYNNLTGLDAFADDLHYAGSFWHYRRPIRSTPMATAELSKESPFFSGPIKAV